MKRKTKGGGDCYYIAGQFAMDNVFSPKKIDYKGTPYLVHAEVQGQGKVSNLRYGHAWIEDDENVYDFSNGRELIIPKVLYYAIGDIKTDNPKKYQKYTFSEARKRMLQYKHYGCWDLDVEYKEGGEVISSELLLAPNGNKSNLNEVQYHLVRTSEFKAWFGDWENSPETASKILDDNGEPLPVYHGTNSEPFVVFYDGSFFTDDYMNADGYASGEMIYEVFLNIKKPLIINARGRKWDNLKNKYGNSTRDIASELDTDKYDGVIFNNINDNWFDDEMGDTQNVYFSINPEQIKLADGTNTTFDANNPDIRYSGGGETPYVSDDFQIGYDGAYEHLIAPNGKLSNLAPKQYHLVRTPEFKAWFGFWDLYGKSKNYYDYGVREIAIALKSEKEYAIKEAVEFLSSQVTKDDVLIPMPSRIGIATDTKKLAEEIAKKTGAKMFNCLVGIERDSIYELKKSNKNVTKFDFKFELNCEIPKARNYFIVDNVIGTGITMKNALQQVIKNLGAVNVNPLVYAIDVKNISKLVDDNGEPLICFHGSNNEFNVFEEKYLGSSNDMGFYGQGFYFTFQKDEKYMKFAIDEAGYYGKVIKPYFIKALNPFIFGELKKYKGIRINFLGTQSLVFLNNIAKKFPQLAEKITLNKTIYNSFNKENEVIQVPISILPDLIDKYSEDLKIIEVEDRGEIKINGYLKSKTKEVFYDYTESGGKKGSYLDFDTLSYGIDGNNKKESIEILLIEAALEKYDGIEVRYNPEGYMTRFPEITDAIKENHDCIMQGETGDELVVFKPTQIKLADGTNTTFDSNNAIRYAKGGIIVGENEENNKFPTFDEAYELIEDSINNQGNSFLDESGDGMFDDKEKAIKYVKEIYDFLLSYYDMGMIPIYRGVMADEVDLEPYSIGESWSLSLDSARNFATHLGGKRKDLKIISAYVPKGNVDWEGAFTLYPLFSDFGDSDSEFELPVPANNKLYNVEVADFNNKFEIGGIFQGTPHEFDRYSTEYMGTGEGQQVFGWGLYFTDIKDIAKQYAKNELLIEKEIAKKSNDSAHLWIYSNVPSQVKDKLAYLKNELNDLEEKQRQYTKLDLADKIKTYRDLIDIVENYKGNIYFVTLFKGDNESDYDLLLWDSAVNVEQLEKIFIEAEKIGGIPLKKGWHFSTTKQSELTPELLAVGYSTVNLYNERGSLVRGHSLYTHLSNELGSDKEASLFLLRAGIDGIKYKSGTLSGMGDKAGYNYVIFDANEVTIENKESYKNGGLTMKKTKAPNGKPMMIQLSDKNFFTNYTNIRRGFDFGEKSYSTGKPLRVYRDFEDRIILLDGHHRISDKMTECMEQVFGKNLEEKHFLQKKYIKKWLPCVLKLKFEVVFIDDKELFKGGWKEDLENGFYDWGSFSSLSWLVGDENSFRNGGLIKKVLLAPNGKPSNLTPEQYRIVRTPSFKEWFGDWENDAENYKMILDENGEPKVLWRGDSFDFNVFDLNKTFAGAFWFTPSKEYGSMRGKYNKPYFIKSYKIIDLSKDYERGRGTLFEDIDSKNVDINSVYITSGIGSEFDEYVCFNPNNIKLADGTNTTFDSKNPDIRYAEGGSIPDLLSSQEVEDKLGKLDWWNDDIIYLSGIEYKKVYLRPEYKRVF